MKHVFLIDLFQFVASNNLEAAHTHSGIHTQFIPEQENDVTKNFQPNDSNKYLPNEGIANGRDWEKNCNNLDNKSINKEVDHMAYINVGSEMQSKTLSNNNDKYNTESTTDNNENTTQSNNFLGVSLPYSTG